MSKIAAAAAVSLSLGLGAVLAHAELTETDGRISVVPSSIAMPTRGSSMAQVETQFGAPQTKHDAVGKPPITRWDYPQFSVYFEGSLVIDAVAH